VNLRRRDLHPFNDGIPIPLLHLKRRDSLPLGINSAFLLFLSFLTRPSPHSFVHKNIFCATNLISEGHPYDTLYAEIKHKDFFG
jgi:hypothetical protein